MTNRSDGDAPCSRCSSSSPFDPAHRLFRRVLPSSARCTDVQRQASSQVLSPVQSGASTVLSAGSRRRQLGLDDAARPDTARPAAQKHRLHAADQPSSTTTSSRRSRTASSNREVGLDQSIGINSYDPVGGQRDRAATRALWYQTITIDKGSGDGVRFNDPVTGYGALVGKVTTVDRDRLDRDPDHRPHVRGGRAGHRRRRRRGDPGARGRQPQPAAAPGPAQPGADRPGRSGRDRRLQDPGSAELAVPGRDPDRHGRARSTPTSCSTASRSRSRRRPTCATSTPSKSSPGRRANTVRAQVRP